MHAAGTLRRKAALCHKRTSLRSLVMTLSNCIVTINAY